VQPAPERKLPQPKLEVSGALVHDFGKMPQMQTSSHTWEVKNSGDSDLELWFEERSCSAKIMRATIGDKQRVRIKPNETAPVEFEWNTKTFLNQYSQGCTIGTNDPWTPIFTLTVKGIVYPAEHK
jgi:Protein of unknown function (DUF1573)